MEPDKGAALKEIAATLERLERKAVAAGLYGLAFTLRDAKNAAEHQATAEDDQRPA